MGYTHYMTMNKEARKEWKKNYVEIKKCINHVYKEFDSILCGWSGEKGTRPTLSKKDGPRFNGSEDQSNETFSLMVSPSKEDRDRAKLYSSNVDWNFCKTARKDYDLPTCIVLLITKAYCPSFLFGSDGFYFDNEKNLDGSWPEAIKWMERQGFQVEVLCDNDNENDDVYINVKQPTPQTEKNITNAQDETPLF